jgi:hypothetical protein
MAVGKWDKLERIAYGNGLFVAVGNIDSLISDAIATVWTSTDGTNWVQVQAGPTNMLSGIAYGNGQFVGVGSPVVGLSGVIVTSADGVNWVQRQAGTTNRLSGIGYGNGQFVAIGGWQDNATGVEVSGTIVTSADGVNWVERPSGTTNLLFSMTYGNGHFVAGGDNGTILESGNIITLALKPSVSPNLQTLSLTGPTGLPYVIQSSTNLIAWETVTNITSVQPTTVIFGPLPPASDHVFYRAYSQ